MEDNNILQKYIQELNLECKDFDASAVEEMFIKLIEFERTFAKKIQKTPQGKKVYVDFIDMIYKANQGLLSMRPYFRQRQSAHLNATMKTVEKNQPTKLYDSPVNFKFISYAMDKMKKEIKSKEGTIVLEALDMTKGVGKDLVVLFEKIKLTRQEIMSNNLFLALGKAKIHARSNNSHFVDMADLVQIANEGLLLAVDKYVPAEDSVFAHVAVGHMVAYLIENGSNHATVSVNRSGRRKLYRIRRLLEKNPGITRAQIAEILKVAEQDVNELMEATSYASLDQPHGAEDDRTLGDVTPDMDEKKDAYKSLEHKDLFLKLLSAYQYLSVIEQKILRLKGVNFMKTLNKLVAVTVPAFKHDTDTSEARGFVVSDKLNPTLVESNVVFDSDKYKAGDVVYFKMEIRNNPIMNSKYSFDGKDFILVPEDLVVAMR